jgi:hypothetical protein
LKRVHRFAAFFCATFALAPLAASAAPITVPTGLNPGDQYRLAFVTSTTRDATSSNIADYNAFVTTAANSVPELAALGTTWKAIGSTPSVAARDNTGTNPGISLGVPIYTRQNTIIATSNADLWDGLLLNPIDYDQTGSFNYFASFVYTGSTTAGLPRNSLELGNTIDVRSGLGSAFFSDQNWITDDRIQKDYLEPFYAISDVVTVPEPSAMVLACLAAAGLAVVSLRRRHNR